jgi:hypothetical protein
MITMNCYVRFTSDLDLRAVAALIADRLFGGVPFVPTDEFDEVPGVRLERPILGLWVTICGAGPAFGLRIDTILPIFSPGTFPQLQFLDLNPYVEQTLASVNEVRVVPT